MLTAEDVRNFYTEGYLVLEGVAFPDEVELLVDVSDRLEAEASTLRGIDRTPGMRTEIPWRGGKYVFGALEEGVFLTRALWCPNLAPETLTISRGRALRSIVDTLFGGVAAADHLLSQIHFKLPRGGSYPLHQDSTNRRYGDSSVWLDVDGRGSYVQSILAIDPMTEENGPLVVYPGNPGHVGRSFSEFGAGDKDGLDLSPPRTILANPGDLILLHPFIWHESDVNRSTGPRRAFVNGYSYPGANRRAFDIPGAGERISLIDTIK